MAVALVASLLALTTPVAAKQSVSTVRVSGTDRFATSVAVSTAASVAGANNTHFVLVNGSSFADALSAAALAGAKNGTIILLPADGTISASATARMAAASNITIVGGFSALPATVETTMRTLRATATITRVSGGDRYATAANVASNIVNTAGGSLAAVNGKKSVFLASGGSFADAVIAAPGAYAGPNNSASTAVVPIMLTATDKLSEATKAQLTVLGVKQVFVLGGTAAVSAATVAEVEALGMTVVRLAGATRYATAVAIADKLTAKTTAGGWGFDDDDIALVNIEQSGGGADALAAASYLGQSKAVALGAGPGALATETSTWLTAHNGATGVAKIHAIGGTVAVSAAQLTSADAAGTIAGPAATITAVNGSKTVTIAFSQTVTKISSELATAYQIMGGATLAAISTRSYSAAKNTVTLALDNPLKTGDIVRVNAGIVTTATGGLTVGLTDVTVAADSSLPTCTVYAATGTAKIIVTCSELVVQNGTLDTDVDTKVTVGSVAVASTADEQAAGSKVVTITRDAGTWSGTGASIVIQKDLLKDLGGNKVGQLTGTTVTDAKAPTVVGLPTYTIAGKAAAQGVQGAGDHTMLFTADAAGSAGNAIDILIVDADQAACIISVAAKVITLGVDINGAGVCTTATLVGLVNAHPAASALVTAYAIGAGNVDTDPGDVDLAGGTSTLTVTTNFTEPVTVANATDIKYNANGADNNEVNSATITGSGTSSIVTTYTLDGTTHQADPAANTSELLIATAVVDRASNAIVSVTPLLSTP
jgi:putative cell wall-binding protein